MKSLKNRILSASLLVAAAASSAFAVDPTSLAEVATGAVADVASNKGMLFTVMGASIGIAVLLMVFYKGKRVAKG